MHPYAHGVRINANCGQESLKSSLVLHAAEILQHKLPKDIQKFLLKIHKT